MVHYLLRSHVEQSARLIISDILYYFFIVAAVIICSFLVYRRLIDGGMEKSRVRWFAVLALVFVLPVSIMGGRAVTIFYYPPSQWSIGFFIEKFLHENMITYHGGFALLILFFSVVIFLLRLPFGRTWDIVFIYLPVGHAVGRIGCLMAGCCWGGHLRCRFFGDYYYFNNPVPLYEIIFLSALHVVLNKSYAIMEKKDLQESFRGTIVSLYLVLYGIFRYLIEFIRTEKRIFGGQTQAQMAMIIFIAAGIFIMTLIFARNNGFRYKQKM
ncbi:MAG TPA: prolipoprotein diacylglyceryl transferase [Spirochaetota bacterium]|nr:prolipoprotein diacylglyceryl transferase [Spirochaetota bacterium]HSA13350.1 prolipoprotein diacylglyceryl transferase [Spirochaetota bacterium]